MIPLRDENPTSIFPIVTISIIVINSLIYLYQFVIGIEGENQLIMELAIIPYEVTHFSNLPESSNFPPLLTLISSMFLHSGIFHLAGNMLYLWIFGNNIEEFCGRYKFILFYLICGLVASLVHIVTDPNSQIPTIGASGAISGILGAYILLYPQARIVTLIFLFVFVTTVYIPAILFLGIWIGIQFINAFLGDGNGGVAWFAHIGGFMAGLILIKFFKNEKI